MSLESLATIVERASSDAAFRAQLASSPSSALAGYDLTTDERAALFSGDASQLRSLGVDARVSKLGGRGNADDTEQWIQGLQD